MTHEILNKQLRAGLEKAGLASVRLYKDNGFFFICSDDATCSGLRSSAIYVNSFRQMTVEQWLEEIQFLLTDETNKNF